MKQNFFFLSLLLIAFAMQTNAQGDAQREKSFETSEEITIERGERPPVNLSILSPGDYEAGKLYLKFKADYSNSAKSTFTPDNSGVVMTGLTDLDQLNQQFEATAFKPVLETVYNSNSKSQNYQQRHEAWGFHLWFEVALAAETNILEAIQLYRSNPAIEIAEPIYKKVLYSNDNKQQTRSYIPNESTIKGQNVRYTPDDPLLGTQWHYNNTGTYGGTAGKDISLFDAWDIEKGHSDVIVAIIDGGIQTDHPDLEGNMWSGVGYNFVDNNSTIIPHSHGTHVAGTVAAETNNSIGVAGVAGGSGSNDGVRLMSCQVFKAVEGGNMGGGFAEAMIYAADNDAAISQNSWGSPTPGTYNTLVLDAIDYFNTNGGGSVLDGGITIFAAGNDNDNNNYYPGYYSGVLVVAATNNKDERSYYSNYGDYIDISAPGGEMFVGLFDGGVYSTDITNNYTFKQGTSMACPHVSGVASLIVSYAHRSGLTLKNDDVFQILKETTDDHYAQNSSFIGKLGKGRLNAHAALLATNDYFSPTALTPDHYFDFDGTMQGWYSVATSGNKNFVWTNQGGLYGGQISSASADNGYVILDNLNGEYTGPNPTAALLYSPFFNLTGATDLFFTFEFKARQLGQDYDPLFPNMSLKLEVSNDGFSSNVQELWSYDFPNTAHLVVEQNQSVDISTLAGNPNIQFRFNYAGGGGYWWLIDDVYISQTIPVTTTSLPYTENFDADLGECYTYSVLGNTKNWEWATYGGNGYAKMNGFNSGDIEEDWLILPGINGDDYATITMNFETAWNYGNDDANNYLKLYYSTDYIGAGDPGTATWTELTFTQPSTGNYTFENSGDIDLSGISGQFYLGFKYRYEPGNYRAWQIDNINITQELITFYFRGPSWMDNNPHNPEVWGPFNGWSTGTMTYDNSLEWWKSTVQVADASAEITYQSRFAEAGFTKYQRAFGDFGSNPSFTTTTGEIWIDASDNLSFSWNGDDFYLAIDKITETEPPTTEPANHVTNIVANADSESQISLSWTDSDAAFYLIKASSVGYADISAPADGTAEPDGTLVKNVGSTIQAVSFGGLDAGTTYYFKIFPYNGSGSTINYKTDGTVPQVSATTDSGSGYYYAGFEGDGETKGAYASGTVTISGVQWDLTEALIGTFASDYKTGNRSVRMRGYGTSAMTMLEDKANGLGSVYFNYRRYGADAQVDWKVEYSTDGGSNWTQIGSVFTAPASDEVQTFQEKINVDGNIRLRIKRETETGSSNRRLNIDDIIITDYNKVTFLADMSLATGFDGETDVVYISGNLLSPQWGEPGTNSIALFSRLEPTNNWINVLNLSELQYQYKLFKNTGWVNGEWDGDPNRQRTVSKGEIVIDLFSYVDFSGDGAVSSLYNWDASAIPTDRNIRISGTAQLDQNLLAKALNIEKGASLNIQPTQQLTASTALTNHAGPDALVIQSDATGTGSLLHNTDNVPATIQRYINGGGYHFVSVPISGTLTAGLFMNSYLYYFDAATTQDWISVGVDPETAITNNQGYMIWYTGSNTTYEFTGDLISGNFTVATPAAASVFNDPYYEGGYNLVPNPYPSAIDWNAASGFTESNLFETIWIFNRGTGNYGTYVRNGGSGTNDVSNIIPVGQSFFVQANTAGIGSLIINQAARTHSANDLLKDGNLPVELLKLKVVANSFSDEIIVQFSEGSSMAFEGNRDAQKLRSPGDAPQLYSLTPEGTELSINTVPFANETIIIPVGFELAANENAVFNFTNLESFDPNITIYLEDLLSDEMIDVREQPSYAFTHDEGNEALRFRLHFKSVVGVDEQQLSAYQIWSYDSKVYVSIPALTGEKALVQLIDAQGKVVYQGEHHLSNPEIINVHSNQQLLIARIITGTQVYTQKVFIR